MEKARMDSVVDNYFGTEIADPYRWMENADSPETISWVEKENRLTEKFLEKIPEREKIKKRLTELWNYPKYTVPVRRGDYYFFKKNDGLQNQAVLYRQKGLEGEPKIIIDPNKLSKDGTASLSSLSYSEDGKLMAYGLSFHGSDRQEIKIRDINSGKDYEEVIKWMRLGGVAWSHDGSGFYYSRYPEPGTVTKEDETKHHRVYFHKLETPQSEDELIYENSHDKELSFYPFITDDGKYICLHVVHGCINKNRVYFRKTERREPFIHLIDTPDADYRFIDNIDTLFYFHTNLNASRGRIIAIDINKPEKDNWKEILPESNEVIDSVTMVNNLFVVNYLHKAHNILKLFDTDGTYKGEVKMPVPGTIGEFLSSESITGRRTDNEMFFSFTSFLYPRCIFRYDFEKEKLEIFREAEIDFDPSGYVTKQVFYPSKDGTKVSMFITHRKGIKLDGNNPVILSGYGGFNISLTPGFGVSLLIWMESGGVYAVANLRGGGEYGEEWHKAGMKEKKQNVFHDFISAAEWLIQNKYTKPEKLSVSGGSNGGLLVSACMVQRPELFGAVVCKVPLTDMLRYHRFTVGYKWVPEYGNAENSEEEFRYIYAYSPLHNIKEGVKYPPLLITSADTDDRVVPAHAKKFAAALKEKGDKNNLVLLKIETKAGHGQGKPTTKLIEEGSDIYSFLFKILGMKM